jgi:hypothetical protein
MLYESYQQIDTSVAGTSRFRGPERAQVVPAVGETRVPQQRVRCVFLILVDRSALYNYSRPDLEGSPDGYLEESMALFAQVAPHRRFWAILVFRRHLLHLDHALAAVLAADVRGVAGNPPSWESTGTGSRARDSVSLPPELRRASRKKLVRHVVGRFSSGAIFGCARRYKRLFN